MTTHAKTLPKTDERGADLARLGHIASRIDEIAAGAVGLFQAGGSFEQELLLAAGIKEMRQMLTPEIMSPVMELMNTDLGFRTDRDPNVINQKTGKPNVPYSLGEVREVFIEARLRGFHLVGNEFNLIAGRFYAAKNGFRRKVTRWPGLSGFKDTYSVPRMMNGGAIVKASATWKLSGVPDSIEREFAIRVNAGSGADQIIGKAERKLLKAVHDRLAGVNTPDGDVGDAEAIPVESTTEQQGAKPGVDDTDDVPFDDGKPAQAEEPRRASEPPTSPQARLAMLVTDAGFTFDQFREWGEKSGNTPEELPDFDSIPTPVVDRILRSSKGLIHALKAEYKS